MQKLRHTGMASNNSVYAVIDTNVLVAALMTKNPVSATVQIVQAIAGGIIIPVFNDEIVGEYEDVLNRNKFKFDKSDISELLSFVKKSGVSVDRTEYKDFMPDPKDRVFYEISLTVDSCLVTGNSKHFPGTTKVVSTAEMMEIVKGIVGEKFCGDI